ncbi:type I-C CRISPR-associated protein Cas8c/Csd1 [Paenibacillus doosanensis]|uniref:CRISPR-associated protein (Cas_Csd1) n=1 Tax=Paenibacillus konkukensis TaxID=2020716 RepID=A0ABY4RVH6_9BACL|nr:MULTISPECIES: type I-C CRISPR-associated protein Cas8c/Csd1 [Paenibacillus]MCS7464515.1 type I-C CRISPR-associated protein Cas8c/Csd1 [Paenibacillus doosanensis]UQZ85447.1 CRISPR-associated protein (Cas_Csd1) [Paenibacillus konkukensis]
MILLALKEYYDRKVSEGAIAQDGWIEGNIDLLFELDLDGCLCNISDLREIDGKKMLSRPFQLPNIGKQALKHSNSGKDANLLWDNAAFVLGLGDKGSLRLQSMIDAIDQWIGPASDAGIHAVRSFLQKGLGNRSHFDLALNHPEYGEILQKGSVKVSFRVLQTGYQTVFLSPIVAAALERAVESKDSDVRIGTCLVTGEQHTVVEATHPVIKGVKHAQPSGANIVSFNKEAFNSYSKTQSFNAPVGKVVASRYVKALNDLLDSPRQRLNIGDASVVFWAEKKSVFETDFSSFFQEPERDNPAAGIEKVKALFESVQTGAYMEESGTTRFFILGLAPNMARISIRFWQVGTVSEFSSKIRNYFEDFEIIKPPKEPEFYSVWRILVNVATQDKSENIPPNLSGDFMRSILEGMPYPTTLLQAVLRRIRSDTEYRVKPVRAALLKAYMNRYHRFYPHPNYKEVTRELDTNQPSVGYQLGRLFAVLEKIQEEANPELNTTIRERYYGAACATPVAVFANLLRLKNHHLAKIERKGRVVHFETLLGEIMGKMREFPAHLNLYEQGLFAIGYYHQRQNFFTSKQDASGKNNLDITEEENLS